MPRLPRKAVFLERASYRQRRLRDVARMLPLLGTVLWLLPLAWRDSDTGTSTTLIYIFGVWFLLIVLSALVSHALRPDGDGDGADTGPS